MKTKVIIMMSLFISLFLTGCEKELVEVPGEVPGQLPPEGKPSDLPDGYFEVTFSAGYGGGDTVHPSQGLIHGFATCVTSFISRQVSL